LSEFLRFFSLLALSLSGLHRGNTLMDLRMGRDRDNQLRALLPPMESDYGLDNLSQAETDALEAAFGDGFGAVGAVP
jgi:hypothetical protein